MNTEESLIFKLSAAALSSCKSLIWPTPFLFLISYWLASGQLISTAKTILLICCSVASAIQYYFYWRITLDEKLLNQLQSEADLQQLDKVLNSLFNINTPPRALAIRMSGIQKLIRYFLISTFCSWIVWLMALGLFTR
ncbi:hypothetical protein [Iodobacter fluviatilis]|uniref:Uncharacterized protein n=1 Tax=Iodobacter fluviatilis TaxID=537 RepID=A0A377Q9W8_9NEIS|nr:hypothetical protein [Iodobacter fluviatilis]TCU88440.1 hypothetical protein EV682_10323 [Iodobacter fluviatilis]STQ91488.1 Uncharacterised protein [Iodobacter fluviatilis]